MIYGAYCKPSLPIEHAEKAAILLFLTQRASRRQPDVLSRTLAQGKPLPKNSKTILFSPEIRAKKTKHKL